MYLVIRTINKQDDAVVGCFDDKELAKEYVKRQRSYLTAREKGYYKLGYITRKHA